MENPFVIEGRKNGWNGREYDPPRTFDIKQEEPVLTRNLLDLGIIWLVVDNPDPIKLVWDSVIHEEEPLTEKETTYSEHYQKQWVAAVKMPIVRENYMEFYQKE